MVASVTLPEAVTPAAPATVPTDRLAPSAKFTLAAFAANVVTPLAPLVRVKLPPPRSARLPAVMGWVCDTAPAPFSTRLPLPVLIA